MNQILVTEEPKERNNRNNNIDINNKIIKPQRQKTSSTTSIGSVARFFAFAIILLGICLSGSGSYAIYQEIKHNSEKDIPTVSASQYGRDLKLIIENKVGIKAVQYSINDGISSVVQGRGQKELETPITLVEGLNKLNVVVIDSKNDETEWVKNYTIDANTGPSIVIEEKDSKAKITITSDTQLDYVVYKYGDNEEVRVEAKTSSPQKIETYVDDIVETEQLLVVEAVDKNGNSSKKEQLVKGTKKPTITNTSAYVDPQNSSLAIINFEVKDNTGLQMVVVYLNGEEAYKTSTDKPIAEQPELLSDGKTFSFGIRVSPGETTIKINAYNVYNQVESYENIIKF